MTDAEPQPRPTAPSRWTPALDALVFALVACIYASAFMFDSDHDIHVYVWDAPQIYHFSALVLISVITAIQNRKVFTKKTLQLFVGLLLLDLVLGRYFLQLTGISLFMDSIGLVTTIILFGTRLGILHVSLFYLFLAAGDPGLVYWAPLNFVVAWCAGVFRGVGGFSSLFTTEISAFIVGATSAILSVPLNLMLLGPIVDPAGSEASVFLSELKYTYIGSFVGTGVSDPVDRMITFALGYLLAKQLLHSSWLSHERSLPYGFRK